MVYNFSESNLGNLCSVGQWLTDNIYEKNNLGNIMATILGQHCKEILSTQCCPNSL